MQTNEQKLQSYREDKDIVFGTKWFQKYQGRLLFLLNAPVLRYWFRWCLRIRSFDVPFSEKITAITPSSFSFGDRMVLVKGKILLERKTDFRTHDKYSKRLYYAFKPLWYMLHFFDWAMLDRVEALTQHSFGFSTLTQYPGSIGTDNPVDGTVTRQANETWANLRNNANGTSVQVSGGTNQFLLILGSTTTLNQYEYIYRAAFLFDTSALTASATISAGLFSLWSPSSDPKGNGSGWSPDLDVYGVTPASDTNLVVGDYSQFGTTSYTGTPITYASWPGGGQYKDFTTFNATGIAAISKTGNTKLAVRNAGYDVANSAPTWLSNNNSYFKTHFSNTAGTSEDPKLVVTYTVPVAPTVTTQAVSDITATSATGNGNVTSDGGSAITERGVCWSTSADPTTSDNKATSAGTTGAFTANITGLANNTLYHVRAYAINAVGTSYGSDVTFTTLNGNTHSLLLLGVGR